ncbi:hypothetical protein ACE1CM_42965 [Microseira sp. BLCC-F43]
MAFAALHHRSKGYSPSPNIHLWNEKKRDRWREIYFLWRDRLPGIWHRLETGFLCKIVATELEIDAETRFLGSNSDAETGFLCQIVPQELETDPETNKPGFSAKSSHKN